MTTKKKRKSVTGWIYADEDYAFHSISAWNDSPQGLYFVLMKHKKDIGKFDCKKVRITVQEL